MNDSLLKRTREHELQLAIRYGSVIGGRDLAHLLGFKTPAAFRQAAHRKRLPFPTFMIQGRQGRYARRHDVALFLAQVDLAIDASPYVELEGEPMKK